MKRGRKWKWNVTALQIDNDCFVQLSWVLKRWVGIAYYNGVIYRNDFKTKREAMRFCERHARERQKGKR